MKKEFFVNAIIERPFIEKEVEVIPREEISSGAKETLREAVKEATDKVEKRLKELGLGGHLYVAFEVKGTATEGMEEILNQFGWKEVIFYKHKKEEKNNGWVKKVS